MRNKVLCTVTLTAVIAISACTVKPNTTDIDVMPISVTENTGDSDMDGNTDILMMAKIMTALMKMREIH